MVGGSHGENPSLISFRIAFPSSSSFFFFFFFCHTMHMVVLFGTRTVDVQGYSHTAHGL